MSMATAAAVISRPSSMVLLTRQRARWVLSPQTTSSYSSSSFSHSTPSRKLVLYSSPLLFVRWSQRKTPGSILTLRSRFPSRRGFAGNYAKIVSTSWSGACSKEDSGCFETREDIRATPVIEICDASPE